jgi:hypothetical protein
MTNYLSDLNGNPYPGILAKAKDNATIRTIETQMLDGSYTVQTIGSPSTQVQIEFYSSTATRRLLQICLKTGQPIKVCWRDRIWTGIISGGELNSSVWSRNEVALAEKLIFSVLMTAEDVR